MLRFQPQGVSVKAGNSRSGKVGALGGNTDAPLTMTEVV